MAKVGPRRAVIAQDFGHHRGVEHLQPRPAVLFIDHESQHAQPAERLPQHYIVPVFAVEDFQQPRLLEFVLQQPANGVLERCLLFGEIEIHEASPILSRGRPRPRSPMMLR